MVKIGWLEVLIMVMFVIVVYMILTRLFGHSATDLAITVGLFTLLFANQYKINRELGEIKISITQSFERVKEDMHQIKSRLKS